MGGCSNTVQERGEPHKWLVTMAVVCGTLCIGVTMSMMNLAVPLMISALQTDIDTIQWIITGPMLVNIALVSLVNWLTSLIGTRQVYLRAMAIWIVTSFPCGLSDTAGGVSFAVIVFLQHGLDYSPLQVGFLLLPVTLGRIAGELAAGHLSDRWGARGLSLAGLLIFAISSAALGRVEQQSSVWLMGALLILGNTGMALSNSPIIHAGLQTLREERMSMGSGLLSLVRIIGGTFGGASSAQWWPSPCTGAAAAWQAALQPPR